MITRRNLMKTAAAGLTLPALTRSGFAADPLKVGFVYLGSVMANEAGTAQNRICVSSRGVEL
jgi:hypothetical protein